MKPFLNSLGARKQNKILRFAASAVFTLALASGIHSVNAKLVKINTSKKITSVSTQLSQTKQTIAQIPTNTTNSQLIPMSPWGIVPIVYCK
jgi:hypothetical protein